MIQQRLPSCAVVLVLLGIVMPWTARAAEVKVVSSGGFAAAYKVLAPEFERRTGNTVQDGTVADLAGAFAAGLGVVPCGAVQREA